MSDNITDLVIDHLYNTKYEDLDNATIGRAKERLIDAIGVLSIGRKSSDVESIAKVMRDSGYTEGPRMCTLGMRSSAENVAFMNSILLRSFDFEPIDAEAIVPENPTTAAHISSTTIPTLLAVADEVGASGKDSLLALILADDIVARVLNASHFSVHDLFDGNGTANALGGAIIAGLLYGLDKDEMKSAISIVVNQMSGTMQNVFEKKMTFKLPNALTSRAGVFSAKLAKAGYGPCLDDPIAGPKGMFELFYSDPKPEEVLISLGEKFVADAVIKPWPCCRATHSSIDATLKALDGKTFKPSEVESVKIKVSPGAKAFVGQGYKFGMDKSYQGAFSIDFLCATAILHGTVTAEFEEAGFMLDPELNDMLLKIEVSPELPNEVGSNQADCSIYLTDGNCLEGHCDYPYGDIYRTRMSEDDFFKKFWSNIEYGETITKNSAEAIIKYIHNLENEPNMCDLMDLIG